MESPLRLRLGLLIPSTNTVVEPEYHAMLPAGVTAHVGRMLVTEPRVGTDELYVQLTAQQLDELGPTVANLVTCRPDHLALCMSAMSFMGGAAGDAEVTARLEDAAGVRVTSGPAAVLAALEACGAARIGLLSPFQPAVEAEAVRYFADHGVDVVATRSFLSPTTTAIAETGTDRIRDAIAAVDSDAVDAVVQVGTNVAMARSAAAAEWWLGKPVLHVNTVMAWRALRLNGVDDRVAGFGSLLAEH